MFDSILIGFDGSGHARDALALASALAGRDEAERRLADVEQGLAADAAVRTIAVGATSAASGLHMVAEQQAVDLLVVGSSHRSAAGRVLLGSTTTQALNAPPCAVAVAAAGLREAPVELKDVTVAYDGGAESKAALRAAVALARRHDARLRLLTVVEPVTQALGWAGAYVYPEYREDALTIAREQLEDAVREVGHDVAVETEIVEGAAARELVAASGRTDLLVLGSRGYGPVRRVLLGGVSTPVAGATTCPVLVLPRSAEED